MLNIVKTSGNTLFVNAPIEDLKKEEKALRVNSCAVVGECRAGVCSEVVLTYLSLYLRWKVLDFKLWTARWFQWRWSGHMVAKSWCKQWEQLLQMRCQAVSHTVLKHPPLFLAVVSTQEICPFNFNTISDL